MEGQEERVLDEQEWRVEAAAVIQDVRECVAHMSVASLPASNTEIHFNLTTKEQSHYCIELTASGFRIVSNKFDDNSEPSEEYFETPYALLDKISPLYRESFSSALAAKLSALATKIDKEDLESLLCHQLWVYWRGLGSTMGQNSSSNPLRENLESLHNQMMKHAGADYDIATTTTLTYDQFLAYITQLNQICREYKDSEGHMLVFAVKKGTDSTVFWKATVRIACVKLNTATNKVQSYRLLNIRQFLQVFRRVTYECTGGTLGSMDGMMGAESTDGSSVAQGPVVPMPPTMAASMVLGGMQEVGQATPTTAPTNQEQTESPGAVGGWDVNLSECMICLERKPDVILPCAHAYCLPCIEQWWEYARPTSQECASSSSSSSSTTSLVYPVSVVEKTCPMCRESLDSTDDTWVLSEAPDSDQVNEEIRKTLISLAGTEGEAPS